PTTSKRPAPRRSSRLWLRLTLPRLEAPGPPKFTNSDPIRSAGLLAGALITASEIIRPSGCTQSRGAWTRAHCSALTSLHGFQAIDWAEAGTVVKARARGRQMRARRRRRTGRPYAHGIWRAKMHKRSFLTHSNPVWHCPSTDHMVALMRGRFFGVVAGLALV